MTDEPWLTSTETAKFLGISIITLLTMREMETGPLYTKSSNRSVLYNRGDLKDYLATRKQASPPEPLTYLQKRFLQKLINVTNSVLQELWPRKPGQQPARSPAPITCFAAAIVYNDDDMWYQVTITNAPAGAGNEFCLAIEQAIINQFPDLAIECKVEIP